MIVVTGGAGFIGSHLVRALNARGREDLLIVDRPERDFRSQRRTLDGLRFQRLLTDDEILSEFPALARNVEAVFHFAACTDTAFPDWRVLFASNYELSHKLLELCLRERVPLIYASSAAVYGAGSRGFREEPECDAPLNLYGVTKSLVDARVRRWLPGAASQLVGLRFFNVYGEGEGHKGVMASMVHRLLSQAIGEGRMRLFEGSDSFARDFVWVGDAVSVTLFFWERPELSGIFNCGTGEAETFLSLAEAVRRQVPDARVDLVPFPAALRKVYQTYTRADLAKLREAGWGSSFLPLSKGVEGCARAFAGIAAVRS